MQIHVLDRVKTGRRMLFENPVHRVHGLGNLERPLEPVEIVLERQRPSEVRVRVVVECMQHHEDSLLVQIDPCDPAELLATVKKTFIPIERSLYSNMHNTLIVSLV